MHSLGLTLLLTSTQSVFIELATQNAKLRQMLGIAKGSDQQSQSMDELLRAEESQAHPGDSSDSSAPQKVAARLHGSWRDHNVHVDTTRKGFGAKIVDEEHLHEEATKELIEKFKQERMEKFASKTSLSETEQSSGLSDDSMYKPEVNGDITPILNSSIHKNAKSSESPGSNHITFVSRNTLGTSISVVRNGAVNATASNISSKNDEK